MKKILKLIYNIIPHIVLVLSAVFMIFMVLNNYNPMMGFLTGYYSRILLWILCIAAYIESFVLIFVLRRKK